MRNKIAALYIAIIALAACNDAGRQDKPVPEALKEKTTVSEVSLRRGSPNLVESLYDELADKNAELKKLEADIRMLSESETDSTEAFTKFSDKNHDYYNAAGNYSEGLQDSVLKRKMKTLIERSMALYDLRTAKQDTLLETIRARDITLRDLHTVLKIVRTLPVMEAYQKDQLPSAKPLEGFIQKQNAAIRMTDSLSERTR